jgi:hypothetical protein
MTISSESSSDLVPRHIHVAGTSIHAHGPLRLPTRVCVQCGSTEKGGTIRTDKVNYVSPWIWLTAFISLLVTWIVYLAARKQMDVQYYLCPKCADKRKIRTMTSSLVNVGSIVGMILVVLIGDASMLSPFLGAFVLSAVAAYISSKPALRAVGHDDGCFKLKGASPVFLRSITRRQLPDETS